MLAQSLQTSTIQNLHLLAQVSAVEGVENLIFIETRDGK